MATRRQTAWGTHASLAAAAREHATFVSRRVSLQELQAAESRGGAIPAVARVWTRSAYGFPLY